MNINKALVDKVIYYSRITLLLSAVLLVTCLLISYPFAEDFSLPVQIGAHILTIVFAGAFKVAVVALMAASKELRTI